MPPEAIVRPGWDTWLPIPKWGSPRTDALGPLPPVGCLHPPGTQHPREADWLGAEPTWAPRSQCGAAVSAGIGTLGLSGPPFPHRLRRKVCFSHSQKLLQLPRCHVPSQSPPNPPWPQHTKWGEAEGVCPALVSQQTRVNPNPACDGPVTLGLLLSLPELQCPPL